MLFWTLLTILGSCGLAHSAINKKCIGTLCYSVNIPDSTAQSGSGDMFFQITGPASYSWIGMGTGSQMAGSNMMVIYQSADGTNVTLSPRSGVGEVEPKFNSDAKVSLLAGSGIINNQMIANIQCQTCSTSTSSFVFAANSHGPLKSDSMTATLIQHDLDKFGALGLDLSSARGGDDSNPFIQAVSSAPSSASSAVNSGSAGTGTATASTPSSAQSSSQVSATSATSTQSATGFNEGLLKVEQRQNMKRMAHGILAAFAFVILFPFGAIAIRLFGFTGVVWFHAGIQAIANVIFLTAFAVGISLALESGEISTTHAIIGIVVFSLSMLQPILGFLHHNGYKRTGGRSPPSYGHIWIGRILITLGLINGGLGLQLADNTKAGKVVYIVFAAIIYVIYVLAVLNGERSRSRKSRSASNGVSTASTPPLSSTKEEMHNATGTTTPIVNEGGA